MGNTQMKSEMKTWAVSQRVSMNHDRLIELRDACFQETKPDADALSRQQLRKCLEKTGVSYDPDGEIILDLFTMWDVEDIDLVPQVSFLHSLCPLMCEKNETLRSFLRSTLEFHDVGRTGYVGQADLILILESLNRTISLLGDSPLSKKRIYNMVYEVVGSTALLGKRNTSKHMSHIDVVNMLAFDPWIRKLLSQQSTKELHVTFSPTVDTEAAPAKAQSDDVPLNEVSKSILRHRPSHSSGGIKLTSSEDSDGIWGAGHPGYLQNYHEAVVDPENVPILDGEAQCILGLSVLCLPILLAL